MAPLKCNKLLNKNMHMGKNKRKRLAVILTPIISFVYCQAVLAESIINNSTDAGVYDDGGYTLTDILNLGISLTTWILGIVGSLTLAMFIYAGFTMLISAGNSQKVSQAKGILMAAVIGLAIVFSSYLIIKFVLAALGYSWTGTAPS